MGKKVIIIGGGAAGCMAAITAAEHGSDITLIEKNKVLGKKILSTGNGRCNFCHETVSPEDYHRASDDSFLSAVIESFSPEDCISRFKKLGITPLNKDGYIYPYSEQARAVQNALNRAVASKKISVITECTVTKLVKKGSGYRVIFSDGNSIDGDKVIITTGGSAAPVTGSTGDGFILAESMGHKVREALPALTQVNVKEHAFKKAAGTRLYAKVSIETEGRTEGCDAGQIQITKTGFSGIPVFNISRFASIGLSEGKNVNIHLRPVPEMTDERLREEITGRLKSFPAPYEALTGLFPDTFCDVLLRYLKVAPDTEYKGDKALKVIDRICDSITDLMFTVSGTGDMASAQVSAGGIETGEIDPFTMESKKSPGLYFAGEIIDIDGICGGYNLYFAWASGYIAGFKSASA